MAFEDDFAVLIGAPVSTIIHVPETSFYITITPDSTTNRYMPSASHGGEGQSRYPAADMPDA